MHITIINDCRDDNARGRQQARIQTLFGKSATFIDVQNDIEAGSNLIDILDATQKTHGIVLLNVAPRNGKAKQWENGTPFGFTRHKDTWIVGTIDGYIFSLAR